MRGKVSHNFYAKATEGTKKFLFVNISLGIAHLD